MTNSHEPSSGRRQSSQAVELIKAICDHLSGSLTSYGRPDPKRTALATGGTPLALVAGAPLHSPGIMAQTLYTAGRALDESRYTASANLCMLWMLGVVRDPFGGRWDAYTDMVAASQLKRTGKVNRDQLTHIISRTALIGIALDAVCRGFMVQYPHDTSFHSKAAALFDWLQGHRTDRGPYFKIGYTPSGLEGRGDVDGAFSSDLAWVGRGLASYYAVSERQEVLDDLLGLTRHYLTSHRENSDDGCFDEEVGSWVICPWALEIDAEHFEHKARADRLFWGFSNRDAMDFIVRVYAWVEDCHTRALIRDRSVKAMKWAFDQCQHDDGAVGMMGRDDGFTGMAGAAILNFLDCRASGMLGQAEMSRYGQKAQEAMDWICSWSPIDIVEKAGHQPINSGLTLKPPENLAWMLAWTVDALLRLDEL